MRELWFYLAENCLGGRLVGGQKMLLDMSESGFGLRQCSKAGSLCLAAEMGWLGEDAEPCLSFPLSMQEKGAFGAAERKRGGCVRLSCQHLGACSGRLPLPLGWLFIRKEAGREERAS